MLRTIAWLRNEILNKLLNWAFNPYLVGVAKIQSSMKQSHNCAYWLIISNFDDGVLFYSAPVMPPFRGYADLDLVTFLTSITVYFLLPVSRTTLSSCQNGGAWKDGPATASWWRKIWSCEWQRAPVVHKAALGVMKCTPTRKINEFKSGRVYFDKFLPGLLQHYTSNFPVDFSLQGKMFTTFLHTNLLNPRPNFRA